MSSQHPLARASRPDVHVSIALLIVISPSGAAAREQSTATPPPSLDAVVARIHEHHGNVPSPLVVVVDRTNFPAGVWRRVKDHVAFRLHRPQPDGAGAYLQQVEAKLRQPRAHY